MVVFFVMSELSERAAFLPLALRCRRGAVWGEAGRDLLLARRERRVPRGVRSLYLPPIYAFAPVHSNRSLNVSRSFSPISTAFS